MEDQGIVALFFERSEQAIAEVDKKYGAYCYSILTFPIFARATFWSNARKATIPAGSTPGIAAVPMPRNS